LHLWLFFLVVERALASAAAAEQDRFVAEREILYLHQDWLWAQICERYRSQYERQVLLWPIEEQKRTDEYMLRETMQLERNEEALGPGDEGYAILSSPPVFGERTGQMMQDFPFLHPNGFYHGLYLKVPRLSTTMTEMCFMCTDRIAPGQHTVACRLCQMVCLILLMEHASFLLFQDVCERCALNAFLESNPNKQCPICRNQHWECCDPPLREALTVPLAWKNICQETRKAETKTRAARVSRTRPTQEPHFRDFGDPERPFPGIWANFPDRNTFDRTTGRAVSTTVDLT